MKLNSKIVIAFSNSSLETPFLALNENLKLEYSSKSEGLLLFLLTPTLSKK